MKRIEHASTGFLLATALAFAALPARAADHGDTPALVSLERHDARITDLHAFTVGDRLVLAVSTNPNIPVGVTQYTFPSDLAVRFNIDRSTPVSFGDCYQTAIFGGTIGLPWAVHADAELDISFENGTVDLEMDGVRADASEVQVFAGLRDDPFIRGPRAGRNVASIVVELPLASVLGSTPTLLIWATTKIPSLEGKITEHGGRALRSQFIENDTMNVLKPAHHYLLLGLVPDVIIFDTSRPAAFPNGRALEDDVVDLVADARVLNTDAPFPVANDVPFLPYFPYLADPH